MFYHANRLLKNREILFFDYRSYWVVP